MPGPRKYLWKDDDGVNRWHDVPVSLRDSKKASIAVAGTIFYYIE